MSKTMKARCVLQVQMDVEYDVEAIKARENVTQERIEETAAKPLLMAVPSGASKKCSANTLASARRMATALLPAQRFSRPTEMSGLYRRW